MRVEFLKDWQRFRVGQTVEHLGWGVVDALLRTKVVRLAETPADTTPEPVAPPPPPPAPAKPKKGK